MTNKKFKELISRMGNDLMWRIVKTMLPQREYHKLNISRELTNFFTHCWNVYCIREVKKIEPTRIASILSYFNDLKHDYEGVIRSYQNLNLGDFDKYWLEIVQCMDCIHKDLRDLIIEYPDITKVLSKSQIVSILTYKNKG